MLNQSNWLPPTSIRNALKEAGFELTGDNPLASIHQVLKRLVARENSPVVSQEHQGQTLYKFDPNRLNPYGATARSAIEAIAQVSAGAREIFEDMGRKNKRAREIISPLEKRD
jgi:hypothetical protein